MSNETQFPEWAASGAPVLAVRSRYGKRDYVIGKIMRLTKTRIIVDFDLGGRTITSQFSPSKYRDGEWAEYGKSGSWDIPRKLISINTEEAKKLLDEAQTQRLITIAVVECDKFAKARTVEAAKVARDALSAFIEREESAS